MFLFLAELILNSGRSVSPSESESLATYPIELALLKSFAPNLVARYNVSKRSEPKWVYRHVKAPGEAMGSEVSDLKRAS